MTTTEPSTFRHYQVAVGKSSLHVVEAGDPDAPPVLFVHGWPQSWRTWQQVMSLASQHARDRDRPVRQWAIHRGPDRRIQTAARGHP